MAELLCWPLSVWQCRNSFESQAGRLMRNCSSRDVDKTSNYEQAFDSRQPSTSIVVAFNSTQTSKLRYTHLWNFRTPIGPRSSDFSVHWFSDVLRSTQGGPWAPARGPPKCAPPPGPEQCYGAKTVVEAHNACAGDPYFPFVLDATVTWQPWQWWRFEGFEVDKCTFFLEIYRCICILAYRKQSVCFVVRIHVEWQIR